MVSVSDPEHRRRGGPSRGAIFPPIFADNINPRSDMNRGTTGPAGEPCVA